MKSILFIFLFLLSFNARADVYNLGQQLEVNATTTSTEALAANGQRFYLLIVNKGTQTVYVKFNASSTGTEGIPIPAGGNYEPLHVPTTSVYVLSSSGTQALYILEGKK